VHPAVRPVQYCSAVCISVPQPVAPSWPAVADCGLAPLASGGLAARLFLLASPRWPVPLPSKKKKKKSGMFHCSVAPAALLYWLAIAGLLHTTPSH